MRVSAIYLHMQDLKLFLHRLDLVQNDAFKPLYIEKKSKMVKRLRCATIEVDIKLLT